MRHIRIATVFLWDTLAGYFGGATPFGWNVIHQYQTAIPPVDLFSIRWYESCLMILQAIPWLAIG